MSYYQTQGQVRGNPYAGQAVSFKQARSSAYAEPDTTAPERLPVRKSTLAQCDICRKQVWTEVRRVRAGIKRTGATDAMFRVIAVAFVHIETDYNHHCPDCGRKLEVFRLVGHISRRQQQQQQLLLQQNQQWGQIGISPLAAQGMSMGMGVDNVAVRGYLEPTLGHEPDEPLPPYSERRPPYTENRTPGVELPANQQ